MQVDMLYFNLLVKLVRACITAYQSNPTRPIELLMMTAQGDLHSYVMSLRNARLITTSHEIEKRFKLVTTAFVKAQKAGQNDNR